jgi:hypothetical protein
VGDGWHADAVRVRIVGTDLPGRAFWSEGSALNDVHVALQVGPEPHGLVRGDAARAEWDVDVRLVVTADGCVDFRGPAVHGRRGNRFLYLTWGNVGPNGDFEMFRRAKLMLDRIDPELVSSAEQQDRRLVGSIRLTDARGGPTCARVGPPQLEWVLV